MRFLGSGLFLSRVGREGQVLKSRMKASFSTVGKRVASGVLRVINPAWGRKQT